VIDYHTQRFEEELRDADGVIDLVGGDDFDGVPSLINILREAMA